jgi:broad-specificity NMP kinase
MQWVDVCGPPGVGKSTLCDPLWGPHDIVPEDIQPPVEWHDFCNEVTRLLGVVRDHPTFVAAVRMNRRSIRKMATVRSMEVDRPYIQTGFVQRGLGFGWRLQDMGKPVDELWHFFRLMPASLGVVFLEADAQEVADRNKAREGVKETAHENRAFMGPLMQPAIEFAKEVLDERDVPSIRIETSGDIDTSRQRLVEFAEERIAEIAGRPPSMRSKYMEPCNPAALGYRGENAVVSSPPVWW